MIFLIEAQDFEENAETCSLNLFCGMDSCLCDTACACDDMCLLD